MEEARLRPTMLPSIDIRSGTPLTLIGFMGVGKTAIGKRLAAILDFDFLDTDQLIVEAAEISIPRIFAQYGEERFREIESQCVRKALNRERVVIATGGGVPARSNNKELILAKSATILLTSSPEVILRRVQPLDRRPMLNGHPDPLVRIKELMKQREEAYSQYHYRVDSSYITSQEAAERIAHWYLLRTQGKVITQK